LALISLKARAGIAVLTFAAAVAPFVLATPVKAITIRFGDFKDAGGTIITLPSDIQVTIQSDVEVPGPVVGAGVPGLIFATGALLAWRDAVVSSSPKFKWNARYQR
jgi:hypothetical protein